MPTVDTSGRFKTKNKKHCTKITIFLDIEDLPSENGSCTSNKLNKVKYGVSISDFIN